MTHTAAWYITHGGRRLLAATKREAHALALKIADRTGKPVTVRPIAKQHSSTRSRPRPMRRNPAAAAPLYFFRGEYGGPGSHYFTSLPACRKAAGSMARANNQAYDVFERRDDRAYPKKIDTVGGFKRNPAGRLPLEVVRDTDGQWYVMKGERIAAGPFASKAAALAWTRPFRP